jgi:hypothetical protein
MTTTADKTDLVSRKPDLIERTFGLGPVEGLPKALGEAVVDLARLAEGMHPDDISLSLDIAAGVLSFRAYRRERR